MTRINTMPIEQMPRVMVHAEWREMFRIRGAYPRKSAPNIGKAYRLGKGHVTFFYNKGTWLERRHRELHNHLINHHGYNLKFPPLDLSHWPSESMNDWEPTEEEIYLSRLRVYSRSISKK